MNGPPPNYRNAFPPAAPLPTNNRNRHPAYEPPRQPGSVASAYPKQHCADWQKEAPPVLHVPCSSGRTRPREARSPPLSQMLPGIGRPSVSKGPNGLSSRWPSHRRHVSRRHASRLGPDVRPRMSGKWKFRHISTRQQSRKARSGHGLCARKNPSLHLPNRYCPTKASDIYALPVQTLWKGHSPPAGSANEDRHIRDAPLQGPVTPSSSHRTHGPISSVPRAHNNYNYVAPALREVLLFYLLPPFFQLKGES